MLKVDSINKGIVIDHIRAGAGEKIFKHLKLQRCKTPVALIMNASSRRLGRKDIIKIDEFLEIDYDFLGFVDPNITINIIENGEITKKVQLKLPERIENIVSCRNPRCITTVDETVNAGFYLTDRESGTYRCMYCDEEFSQI